ncbi:TTF-type domain-containing protein [Citrus sinensis]|uniref:TTF-type domain-containing protein n=1 Tax=Citrus sinensis TaxID=2711 RepID=A0ACB8N1F4_CITSI|nr:TTF-type domain-containing protein [Citrus sinensis]
MVKDGKNCAFFNHVGKDPNSTHKKAEKSCEDLMRQSQHLPHVFNRYSSQEIENNRLRLKTTVEAIRYLAFQGCSFRGHDESKKSLNRGIFLQLLKAFVSNNEKIAKVILDKAPKYASYISPNIQKEILHVFSMKVKKAIREEIGDAKFCLIVDESRDESKKEQMAVVLRFVDKDGFVREPFFRLVHVSNTSAVTLKDGIYSLLSHNNLNIQNIRGQGYDGASNMRGEWNGLQALILKDCPYAYYIHCLAHRLQLALVAVSHEIVHIHHFFIKLTSVVNIVGASCKRNEELKHAQAADIEYMISINELESGRGLNQIGTLQRPRDTWWSSHFRSVSNLIKMFSATCSVLLNIIEDGTNAFQRGDVDATYEAMTTFEFVFILHLMKEIMAITDILCQALQSKSQDILHVMHLVSSTKALMQKFRDDGWITLLNQVKSFCKARNIDIPKMNAHYVARQGRARRQEDNFTVAEHYRVNLFYAFIDCQLQELSSRFNEHAVLLLILSSAFNPHECRESFRIGGVCQLADKFYPANFTDVDKMNLKIQLEHYEYIVVQHPEFKSLSIISDLSQWLVRTRKATIFPIVYRIIVLVLTLPVSTATTERSFSLCDEFLTDSLIMYIEREIVEKLSIESIVNEFRDMKERRIPF